MNPIDPAELPLRDIHLPPAVGSWPPAPGWWLVALIGIAAAGWFWWKWQRDRVRRIALGRLRTARAALDGGGPAATCIAEVAETLRRYCMTAARDPAEAAGLVGRSWLAYLDSHWRRDAFTHGTGGRLLIEAPYRGSARRDEAEALIELGIEWLEAQKGRRRGGQPCGS